MKSIVMSRPSFRIPSTQKFSLAIAILLCLTLDNLSAQDVRVRGGFFEDSVHVGDETRFYLTATYNSKLTLLFPDSAFNYAPFEYNRKKYFPTHTTDGVSYDSVIYYLNVFDIEPKQILSLPVFQINETDSTIYQSGSDTLQFVPMVGRVDTLDIKKLPLKQDIAYQPVAYQFNYPVFFFGLAVVLVLIAVAWFIFGKRIRRYYRIKRLIKAHKQFVEIFSQQIVSIKATPTPVATEIALASWKKYMEQLERKPYTKLTSREIQRIEKDDRLGKNLHGIDEAIYGHNPNAASLFYDLHTFTDQRFTKKLEEIKHG